MKNLFLAFFTILFINNINATIIVGNPFTDFLYVGQNYSLDVNGDGVNDYLLTLVNSTTVKFKGLNGNKVETGGDGKAKGLSAGVAVGSNSWEDSATVYQSGGTNYFPLDVSSYLGLKFIKNNLTYYGYFKLELTDAFGTGSNVNSITLYSYAYENTPSAGILTGAEATGIDEFPSTIDWIFKPNEIVIDIKNKSVASNIEINDIQGKLILSCSLIKGVNKIDLSNIKYGLYIISVNTQSHEKHFVRKIFIE